MAKVKETPMMSQYNRFKRKYPDAILLFRVGDFYETFSDDAVAASQLLGITLTKRSNGGASEVPLAGFPYHALDVYLPKLVSQGKRVAICDQIEDPKLTKTLVKRDVTELVTPGLTMEDTVLDAGTNNFLGALVSKGGRTGAAFLDLSTGEFCTAEGVEEDVAKMVVSFGPKEILLERGREASVAAAMGEQWHYYPLEDWVFTVDYGRERLERHFNTRTLKGFGIEETPLAIIACGAILYYLEATKHTQLSHVTTLHLIEEDHFVRLDNFTRRNLEIMRPLTEDGSCLLQVLDHTHTPMGGRLLKRWLSFPLLDLHEIERRQTCVAAFCEQSELTRSVADHLAGIGDLERLASKVAVGRISPRELLQTAAGLRLIRPMMSLLTDSGEQALRELSLRLDPAEELASKIEQSIDPDAPAQVGKGRVIRTGVSSRLDELRAIAGGGKKYLLEMRERESRETGIPSLKIAFNNVFGYYIEVTNAHKDKVPEDWIRKQTLVNSERYITPELKEYEQKILGAEERISILEAELYQDLIREVMGHIRVLQSNAAALSEIDVLSTFAYDAVAYDYHRPVVDRSAVIDIKEGRHPVIERMMPPGEEYISNDVFCDPETDQIMVITGPNMSGKSALLRQTALIVLMAQVGSFVPAREAHLGIVDRIFTRVGASDNISRGESTFMVEMTESAIILNNITPNSLVLVDELGRGTSTYDGISLAQAIVEYLHNNHRAHPKTLFATHYHELNELEGVLPRIRNYNVSVKEAEGKVIFLRKLVPGGCEHSFGIHVARMAGMPREIVSRAEEILSQLERKAGHGSPSSVAADETTDGPMKLSFFQLDDPTLSAIRDEIKGLDIDNLTPLEALNKLSDIRRLIGMK